MSIGTQIAQYRKDKGITQEALAHQLNVTNQAVSKWESDQCCPDIQMLPKLADLFDITIDALFERETIHSDSAKRIPWRNDDSFHIGLAKNISSAISVECGDVQGNVDAGADVTCGDVKGNIDAGGTVTIRK